MKYDDKNLEYFNNTESFQSITTKKQYNLIDLNEMEICYLKQIIHDLEKSNDVILCCRGDSKKNHSKFISKDLYDFFVAGTKSKYHEEAPESLYDHCEINDEFNLEALVEKCNSILEDIKECNSDVEGRINPEYVSEMKKQSIGVQNDFRFLLLSFLHNKGMTYADEIDSDFKPYSCFVSLAYNKSKYDTAKKYALGNNKIKNKDGLIYIYIVQKNWKNYITIEEMTSILNDCGVKWKKGLDEEIMIMNGLYPHFLVGFFEMKNEKCSRFILNSWFHKQIKHDLENLDTSKYTKGMYVNQEDFEQSAQRLGYNTVFLRNNILNGNEFILSNGETKKTIERLQ
ncbi:hypothetical protein EFE42_09720 [Methanohalophilus sp. RSK]|uniref:hypothetical protein n=1 Tax=Methanohalophilus sp. RSK TaxID=2485783 RepID=UPI000F43D2D5|nr:hypothetical protein [Methanohalophilus sp. RSK]RNI11898.1 hypothetical protein EFE42_09720 [Methanohalophilus sp. RSK]